MVTIRRPISRARSAFVVWLAGSLAVTGWLLLLPSRAQTHPHQQASGPRVVSYRAVENASVAWTASGPPAAVSRLRVARDPATVSYLRFEVTGVGDQAVRRATLRLYAYEASPSGYVVQLVDTADRSSSSAGSSRRRPPGRIIGASGAYVAGALTEVDLTPFVTADGIYSFALSSAADGPLAYAGLSDRAFAPRLFLVLAEPEVAVGVVAPTQPAPTAEAALATVAPPTPAPATAVPPSPAPPTQAPIPDVSGCEVSNLMWTVPGRLLRGGRPSADGMRCLAAAGVDVLIDQRPPEEAGAGFAGQAADAGLEYINLGIPDDTAPSPGRLGEWLATVNAKLAEGKVVLVHDAAGRGRMGFWDAVYRMRYGGLSPQAAIDGYYVGTAVPFQGAKINCGNGGNGQVQALSEIAQAISGQAYYPPVDEYGNGWANCPRPAYMEGWDYSTLF
jgi:hypothetical protein